MKTENLAVMFTDIAGFTARTSRQTREENAAMLRRHDALLLPVVRAFGGRRVKAVGDALLVVFGSPTDSVLCGMAIQDRLWDYNRRVPPPERLEVRVAVNLGEVRVARLAGSEDCGTRRGAAGALGASRSREALGPLRRLAEAEPPAPEHAGPVEGLRRLLGADGRCGDGDLAREAILDIEESP